MTLKTPVSGSDAGHTVGNTLTSASSLGAGSILPNDLRSGTKVKHPFESCFHDMGGYSGDDALGALSRAILSNQRGMNAFDWAQTALPGAALKAGYAFGTVGELHRSFARDQEYGRFKRVVRNG